jgi:hypothetical protein
MYFIGHTNVFAMFIDCNCLETCTPGGGPAEDGENARRWDPLVQQAYYNGWKSIHGLKHQTVDNALGMTMDIHGPYSLRKHDVRLLRWSDINDRIAAANTNATDGSEYEYCIFGDSAYRVDTHLRSYLVSQNAAESSWNTAMKTVRISIEWNYKTTDNLWAYVTNKRKFKILNFGTISRVYITATILRNFHCILNGNQSSNYFNYVFPDNFLEKYVHQELFN